jgi:hypothetical protein
LVNYPKVQPVATEAFSGRMKILGKMVINNLYLAKVEAWAEELVKKFSDPVLPSPFYFSDKRQ